MIMNASLNFTPASSRRKTGKPLDKKIQFLLEMYCRGSIYMTVEWARKDMDLEPEEMADLLILLYRSLWRNC